MEKKCPSKLLLKKCYLLWGLRLHLTLSSPFLMKNFLLKGPLRLDLSKSPSTLKIALDVETIIPSPLTIIAYKNTSRKVMGTFKAPYNIGPLEKIVEFRMMDITPNYNLLLERAWLHPVGAIPSTLHQKMKIPWK